MDGTEDADVGSGTSFTTKSVKYLPLDMAQDAEVGDIGDSSDNKTVKKSPFSKKLSGSIRYFYFLHWEKIPERENKALVRPMYNAWAFVRSAESKSFFDITPYWLSS